jgi:hypothetical protein
VSARIVVSTVADGTLYDQTFSLVTTEGISDWYDYFFEEIAHKSKLLVTGLPVYADPSRPAGADRQRHRGPRVRHVRGRA